MNVTHFDEGYGYSLCGIHWTDIKSVLLKTKNRKSVTCKHCLKSIEDTENGL